MSHFPTGRIYKWVVFQQKPLEDSKSPAPTPLLRAGGLLPSPMDLEVRYSDLQVHPFSFPHWTVRFPCQQELKIWPVSERTDIPFSMEAFPCCRRCAFPISR